jgi:hypothetical protein
MEPVLGGEVVARQRLLDGDRVELDYGPNELATTTFQSGTAAT